ncbi:MAG: class I SAM-dependent methyltransferase, partial [Sphingobacteriales bacterium]
NTVDCVMATEVLEHCFEPQQILGEIFRVLKPGGKFFFTVPFLWPLHEVPYDAYRYTPFSLDKLFREAGFNQNEIKALGGWDASLAQMMGLWVRRRPLAGFKRTLLSKLALIGVKYLLSKDERPQDLNGTHMITGLTGIAVK